MYQHRINGPNRLQAKPAQLSILQQIIAAGIFQPKLQGDHITIFIFACGEIHTDL